MAVKFSNNARTNLSSAILSTATSITVNDATVFPTLGASDHTFVTIESLDAVPTREIVKVTAIDTSTDALTVVRGQDGTTAAAFSSGAKVELRLTAALLNAVVDDTDTESVSKTGDTMTGDLSFGDDDKLLLGAGNDLKIYHSANNTSYIHEVGSGDLRVLASDFRLINAGENSNMIRAFDGGAVELFHAGSERLSTTSGGIEITGTVTGGNGSFTNLTIDATEKLRFDGAGGHTFIQESSNDTLTFATGGSTALTIRSDQKIVIGDTGSHTDDLLQIETPASGGGHGIQIRRNDANGDQTLGTITWGNNTAPNLAKIRVKTDGDSNNGDSGAIIFQTRASGSTLESHLTLSSNKSSTFAGNVQLNSRLTFGYNSHYFEAGTNSLSFKNSSGSTYATINNSGITSSGAVTTTQLNINSSSYDNRQIGMDSNGFFIFNAADSRYDLKISDSGVSTFANTANFYGNGAAPLVWGNTSGVGALSFSGSDAIIRSSVNNADLIFQGNSSGLFTALRLDMSLSGRAYFNAGASFNGNINANDNQKLILGTHDDFQIYHSGTESWIKDSGTGNLYIDTNGAAIQLTSGNTAKNMIVASADGGVTLYHNNSVKLNTSSTGVVLTSPAGSGQAVDLDFLSTNTSGFGSGLAIDSRIRSVTGGSSNAYHSKLEFYTNDTSNNLDLALTLDSAQKAIFAGDASFAKGTRSLDLTFSDSPPTGDVGVQFRAGSGDYLGLAAGGGTGVGLVVDSSNRVGIGHDSPAGALHVRAAASGATSFDSRYNIILEDNGENYLALYAPNNSFAGVRFLNASSSVRGYIDYYHGTQGDKMVLYAQNQFDFTYPSHGTKYVFKPTAMGIGTSNPSGALHAEWSNNAASGNVYFRNTSSGSSAYGGIYFGNDSALTEGFIGVLSSNNSTYAGTRSMLLGTNSAAGIGFMTSGGLKATIDASGNLGLGISSPRNISGYTNLSINGSTSGLIDISTNGTRILSIYGSGNHAEFVNPTSSGQMRFYTNNVERIKIDPSGNIVVNDSSYDADFRIESDGNANMFRLDGGTNTVNIGSATGKQTAAHLNVRKNGGAIEFGHGNNTSGYYGTLGSYGNNGMPYIGFSTYSETNANTFTTNGFAGNIIVSDQGTLQFNQVTNSSATGQTPVRRMTLNTSGDWMVSNTVANVASGYSTQGGCGWVESDNHFEIATTNNRSSLEIGRNNANDGDIVTLRKQSTVVGSLFTDNSGDLGIGNEDTGLLFVGGSDAIIPWNPTGPTGRDSVIKLGLAAHRFRALNLSAEDPTSSDTSQIRFLTTTNSSLADAAITTSNDSGGTDLLLGSNFRWHSGTLTRFDASRSGSGIRLGYTGNMRFYTESGSNQPTERMVLDSVGNLLLYNGSPEIHIGTTSASHYNWRVAAQEVVDMGFEIASGTQSAGSSAAGDTYTTRFVIKGNTGNIGIGGVTSPSTSLQVGGSLPQIRLEETGSGGNKRLDLSVNSSGIALISANQSAQEMRLQTTSQDRITIKSNGRIGIGEGFTSPLYALELREGVNGDWVSRLYNTNANGLGVLVRTDATAANNQVAFGVYTNNAYLLQARSNGLIGINTTTPGATTHIVAQSGTTGLLVAGVASNDIASFYDSGGTKVAYIDANDTIQSRGTSAGYNAFLGGASTQSQYTNLQLNSNNGSGQMWKAGTGYSSWGGASSLNIYNSHGTINFHPNSVANALTLGTTGNATFNHLVGINKGVNAAVALSVGADSTATNSYALEVCNSSANTRFLVDGVGNTFFANTSNAYRLTWDATSGLLGHRFGQNATRTTGVLEITDGGTPSQIKITTNIPYSGTGASTHAHTVTIRGFVYGTAETADIQISWHVYANSFYSRTATSSGSWAPAITLAVENNKVVIHLSSPGYWPKLYVESLYNTYGGESHARGWSWTDAAISADSGTPNESVNYKNDFGNLADITTSGVIRAQKSTGGIVGAKAAFGSGQSNVHGSYALYNNDNTYLNGDTTVDAVLYVNEPVQANDGIRAWTDSGTKYYTHLATGSFYTSTGYIVIHTQIPGHNQSGNANMFSFRVTGFWYDANAGGTIDMVVGAYAGENNYHNRSYSGTIPDAWIDNVRFYTDANGKVALVLGTSSTSQKCEIAVTDFVQGYVNVNTDYAKNWSTEVTTSLTNYTSGVLVEARNNLHVLRGNTTQTNGNFQSAGQIFTSLEGASALKSRFLMGKASGSTSDGELYLNYATSHRVYVGAGGSAGLSVIGSLDLGSSSSTPGSLYVNDTSTTSYTLGLIGTGTRGYTFRGSSSSGNYNLTFENAGTGDFHTTFKGNIYVGNGSSSSPSITFDNDSDTGFYKGVSNSIAMTCGGSASAFLSAHDWDIFKAQNGSNRLKLYNNRQDAGNVPVSKISAYNSSAEVGRIEFYRGGGSSSGYVKISTKAGNNDSLTEMVRFGADGDYNTVFKGTVTAQGSVSDIRRKENVEIIPDALEKVKQLDGITFNFIGDDTPMTGLIAQQVQEVLPSAVYETETLEGESTLALHYGNTVGLLVESIKTLEAQVSALTKTIEEMKNGSYKDK